MPISANTVVCMKTTINLPDGLVEQAKQRAAERGCTFTTLIAEGLLLVLQQTAPATRTPLPTWGQKGDLVLVDIEDREAVWQALDGDGWK